MSKSKSNRNKNKTKTKRKNKNTITKSDYQRSSTCPPVDPVIPLDQLPSDLSLYLLDTIAAVVDKPTLACLIRVDHRMYDHFAPFLYGRLEISMDNMEEILYGLDMSFEHKGIWFDMETISKIFGQTSSSHNRKRELLNMVNALVITDYFAANAIAESLHPKYRPYIDKDDDLFWEARAIRKLSQSIPRADGDRWRAEDIIVERLPVPQYDSITFKNLENISLGYEVLACNAFYTNCAHDGDPIIHPVTKILAKDLDCKTICLDHQATTKFHQTGDENFEYALDSLVGNWKFTTANWHNMNQTAPPCDHSLSKIRLFFNPETVLRSKLRMGIKSINRKSSDKEFLTNFLAIYIDSHYWCCAHPRKDEKTIIEVIYPGFRKWLTPRGEDVAKLSMEVYEYAWEEQNCGKDGYEDCMSAARVRWKERSENGWFERYLRIVDWDDAQACDCCGKK
ncbi:hypothetical protein I302_100108 [Kwoniella bestiolae CBS 10118]|uniref:Uncharacterized protein n=1 Tax=Kwoniella bestiolae CBS 10118 TaxID=1296100 RepID=A0A1B9G450_9TREE|nr:hypothetical protein I302_03482 [Kwoniella bestiolae CBS 10118]OCF25809.1 hypothetical protein I302_03482 [Kwoniella bestiolae CBS 10118]